HDLMPFFLRDAKTSHVTLRVLQEALDLLFQTRRKNTRGAHDDVYLLHALQKKRVCVGTVELVARSTDSGAASFLWAHRRLISESAVSDGVHVPSRTLVPVTRPREIEGFLDFKTFLKRNTQSSVVLLTLGKQSLHAFVPLLGPIYNNRRYKSLVLETYKDVRKVLFKHGGQKLPTLRDIVLRCTIPDRTATDTEVLMLDDSLVFLTCIQKSLLCKTIRDFIAAQRATANKPRMSKWELRPKEFKFEAEKLQLFNFQVDVIEMAKKIYNELEEKLKKDLERVLERVMAQAVCVSDQFRTEVACELSRIGTSGAVTKISDRTLGSPEAQQLLLRVKRLLKDSERYVGGLSISEEERHQIVKAMNDVRRGAWYKCPNGHIYCIADCGGAVITSTCPDCNATIGGTSHRLLANNSLASEMDEAIAPAWPQ
ncbi:hypothetical protein FHG87_016957, partial [Trinorchestia longiramus]